MQPPRSRSARSRAAGAPAPSPPARPAAPAVVAERTKPSIAVLPFTNLFHIFSSPANIFVAPFRNKGALWPIKDLEEAEQLGAARLTDFPQPRLVNFDACTECGRCQDVCPAYAAQEPLNPKYVILDLRNFMTEVSPELRALPPAKRLAAGDGGAQRGLRRLLRAARRKYRQQRKQAGENRAKPYAARLACPGGVWSNRANTPIRAGSLRSGLRAAGM